MKKLLNIASMFALAGIIISSCSPNVSITKRRYTKGYYVEHHSKKHQVKTNESEKVAIDKKKEPVLVLPKATLQPAGNNQSVKIIPQEKKALAAGSSKNNRTIKSRESFTKSVEDLLSFTLVKPNPLKAVKALPDKLGTADAGDTALSLAWIIIVVLAILYLLGILLDVAGGSGLIHLFAVVILILLILWLLRII
jgi:hypothetical protein